MTENGSWNVCFESCRHKINCTQELGGNAMKSWSQKRADGTCKLIGTTPGQPWPLLGTSAWVRKRAELNQVHGGRNPFVHWLTYIYSLILLGVYATDGYWELLTGLVQHWRLDGERVCTHTHTLCSSRAYCLQCCPMDCSEMMEILWVIIVL